MSATPSQTPPVREATGSPGAGEVVWDSLVEAATGAFLVWVLGGMALSIAGGFADGMIPSPPPFHYGGAEAEPVHRWAGSHWLHSLKAPALVFLFVLFFAHSLWVAVSGHKGLPAYRRVERILNKLRKDWFGLIVRNAIGAWMAALVLVWVSRFSMAQMALNWICGVIFSAVHDWAGAAMGPALWARIEAWFKWYGANQMKLNFWFLYLAGICDDLGLPNVKALGRWLWRRWNKRRAAGDSTNIEQAPVSGNNS